jgi:folate-binding protein YgfZ
VSDLAADRLADDARLLRRGTGAVALERDVVTVTGPDAASYLQGQVSQDVDALTTGGSAETLVLNPDGKIASYARLTRADDDLFLVDLDAGFAAALLARFERFRLRTKVAFATARWSGWALRGDAAWAAGVPWPDAPGAAGGAGATDRVDAAVHWPGWVGRDLLAPGGLTLPVGATVAGAAAYELCRIETGIPVLGRELDDRTIAVEAGLVERAVSLTKGCYTGQELVARLDARGNKVARRLCGLLIESPGDGADGAADALVGAELPHGGTVTSAAWSPERRAVVALAYVHRSIADGDAVEVVTTEGRTAPATVRHLPFDGD